MKVPDITLHYADDLAQACKFLQELGSHAKAIAGGTDLVVDLKMERVAFKHIIVLQGIEKLNEITIRKGKIHIGALATLASIAGSPVLTRHFPALSDAASVMATPQVRNMGTIGGNIAMGVPSADMPPALIVGDAQIVTESIRGNRIIPIRDFFTGPRKTLLGTAELIKEIVVRIRSDNTGISYEKFQLREAAALAVVGVAASLTVRNGEIEDACIALGAVAPTPVIAEKAGRSLIGKVPGVEAFEEAGRIACGEGDPISDIRGSKEFRCHLIGVLTRRALRRAYGRITAKNAPTRKKRK
jgi:CO/xanthine dehydrogenase FAD-binding subunit